MQGRLKFVWLKKNIYRCFRKFKSLKSRIDTVGKWCSESGPCSCLYVALTVSDGKKFRILIPSGKTDFWYTSCGAAIRHILETVHTWSILYSLSNDKSRGCILDRIHLNQYLSICRDLIIFHLYTILLISKPEYSRIKKQPRDIDNESIISFSSIDRLSFFIIDQ